MISQPNTPTANESLLAAISHFFGWLAALIVWATQKGKSRFVRFQAIQAITFDVVSTAIITFIVGLVITGFLILLAIGVGDITMLGSQNPTAGSARTVIALMDALPLLIGCLVIFIAGIIFIARVIATIQTIQGKDFRYPWLGALVERSIGN